MNLSKQTIFNVVIIVLIIIAISLSIAALVKTPSKEDMMSSRQKESLIVSQVEFDKHEQEAENTYATKAEVNVAVATAVAAQTTADAAATKGSLTDGTLDLDVNTLTAKWTTARSVYATDKLLFGPHGGANYSYIQANGMNPQQYGRFTLK